MSPRTTKTSGTTKRRSTGAAKRKSSAHKAKAQSQSAHKAKTQPQVELPTSTTVRQLAELIKASPVEIIKQLMREGFMANINQSLDYETAATIAMEHGCEVSQQPISQPLTAVEEIKQHTLSKTTKRGQKPRPPVVTVMGHVDHGKTSLLDAIRQTNVVDQEVGAITQHIGAYQADIEGRKITFIDTPGHEAFTAMRARGAHATDIAVLVVSADDGVMPQTAEAISHAQAAGVPIVVALNKIDKAGANPEQVKQQLTEHGLLIEEWGGDVICIPVSAKKGQGIPDLLEHILLVAEMLELKANPSGPAVGTIIEAAMDKTKGPMATVLVQSGTLSLGDTVLVGDTVGRLKAMFDDRGNMVKEAQPATPVKILGLQSIPQAGDTLTAVKDERKARSLAETLREERLLSSQQTLRGSRLEEFSAQTQEGKVKELNIVLRTDVQGSIEPIKDSIEQINTEEIAVRVIHADSGSITEGDIMLALASKGIVVGFNTKPTLGAQRLAELHRVQIRSYKVIYELIEDIQKALRGMLEPTYVDVLVGRAEIRDIFSSSKWGKIAGAYVLEGKVTRNATARIMREGNMLHEAPIGSLRRFKDDAKEVTAGLECGISIDDFGEFQVGDIVEAYQKEQADGAQD
jgi:translation initiation factor IF-2